MTTFDLEAHIRSEHHKGKFSHYLREVVYGGNDGIVTTFAVVAGFAGAQKDPATSAVPMVAVLLFGLANLLADGISMSLGSFLSLRADQDVYHSEQLKEAYEIRANPGQEFIETVEILRKKGYSQTDAKAMTRLYQKNKTYWAEFMMKDELEMPNPFQENPLSSALATFFAFVLFGAIPILPFAIFTHTTSLFGVSVLFTAGALILLGILRSQVGGRSTARALVETILVGGISAFVAYAVGTLFRA